MVDHYQVLSSKFDEVCVLLDVQLVWNCADQLEMHTTRRELIVHDACLANTVCLRGELELLQEVLDPAREGSLLTIC